MDILEQVLLSGYNFHTVQHGNIDLRLITSSVFAEVWEAKKLTMVNQQIVQISYHGVVGLKVTVLRSNWFDTTSATGTRMCKLGVVEVFVKMIYDQYDPFILTMQADQICFFRYPRVNVEEDEWLVVVKVSHE